MTVFICFRTLYIIYHIESENFDTSDQPRFKYLISTIMMLFSKSGTILPFLVRPQIQNNNLYESIHFSSDYELLKVTISYTQTSLYSNTYQTNRNSKESHFNM